MSVNQIESTFHEIPYYKRYSINLKKQVMDNLSKTILPVFKFCDYDCVFLFDDDNNQKCFSIDKLIDTTFYQDDELV